MQVPFSSLVGSFRLFLSSLFLFDWPLGLGIQQSIAPGLEFDGMNTNVVEQHWHMTGCLYLYR